MTSTVTLKTHDLSDFATLTTLTAPWGETWTDTLNDVGSGASNLQLDDAQLSAVALGKVVRVLVDTTPAFSFIVDHHNRRTIPPVGEEDEGKYVTVSGEGLAQVLNRAVVRPTRGFDQVPWSDARTFSFASPEYTPSGWSTATVLNLQHEESTYYTGLPTGWPDPQAAWICPSVDNDTTGHEGNWYAIGDFTLAADSALVLFLAADNKADVYFDGLALTQFGTDVGFTQTTRATVFASAGTHRIAARISNYVDGGVEPGYGMGSALSGDPTAFLCSCYPIDSVGRLGPLAIHTDAAWSILEYPSSPPGMTAGQVYGILVAEAQADGELAGLTVDFTDTDDTASNAWDVQESFTLNVGDSLLDVARTFSGAYWDWGFHPDALTMSAWRFGEKGTTRSITFDATNLTSLIHDQIDAGTDNLVVGWSGGQFREPASGGTRQGFLKVGNARTRAEADFVAQQQLTILGGTRTQITATIEPAGTSDQPYTGFVTGDDGLTMPTTTGGTSAQRCVQIGCAVELDSGAPLWQPVFRDLLLGRDARLSLNVKRMASGTLGGYSTVAAIGTQSPQFGSKITSDEITFSAPDPLTTGVATKDKRAKASGNLYAVAATLKTAGSTDTTFEYLVDGVDVLGGAGTIPSGDTFALFHVNLGFSQFTQWIEGNKSVLTVNITAVGTDAAGLLLEGRVL